MDHPRPLAHPANSDATAADLDLFRGDLGDLVSSHDRPRCLGAAVRAHSAARDGDPGLDRVHGQVTADHAGRADQHLIGIEVEPVGSQLRHLQRVLEALGARARVGVAGIDHQRLDAVVLEVELVDDDRRRLDLVRRKDPARVARKA